MKYSNLIIWLIGVGLIIFLCILSAGIFEDSRLLFLDGGVLICAYTLSIYVYGGLFHSREEFTRDVPAAGVRISAFRLYAALAVIGIILGLVYSVSFSWQTFYQLCFLFLMIVGLLLSNATTDRLRKVADTSQQRGQSRDQLVALAQQLRITASVNTAIDVELRGSINKLSERMAYISPSNTPTATSLEHSLKSTVLQIQEALDNGADASTLTSIVEKATILLSQRIKTY